MARTFFTVTGLCLLAACAIPRTVARLQDRNPPPEFGRPAWVRFFAGTGAWIGGVVGGAASIVLLPVTWPLSLVAGDGLGEAGQEEIMFFPAVGLAATGHFLLGGPPDIIDFTVRRAWFEEPLPPNTYELVPMSPPKTPRMDDVLPEPGQEPEPGEPAEGQPGGQTQSQPQSQPGGQDPGRR